MTERHDGAARPRYAGGVLSRAAEPQAGDCIVVGASPFAALDGQTRADPRAFREHLRRLYRQAPRLFTDGARDAAEKDITLVGDETETAVLYDALCRVARASGFDIGVPLERPEAE